MKKTKIINIIVLFFLLFIGGLLSGCMGFEPTLVVITKDKTPTQLEPTSTNTFIPPTTGIPTPTDTKIATITPVPSNTVARTETRTSTQTLTFTPEPASLTLAQDTACFAGTGFGYELLAYVSAGEKFPILATIEDQSWWFVSLEQEKNCWIFGDYAISAGVAEDLPVITPSPPASPTATLPPTSYGIYYMLIAKDTGGPFGCGDSLIRYYPGVWVNGNMEEDILAALNALFSNHNQYVNGLYNPIYESTLKAKGVEMVGGDVVVQLGGSLVRPKDKCESQRMRDQIWYTISQFSPTRAVVYLNNALLGDLLVVTNK